MEEQKNQVERIWKTYKAEFERFAGVDSSIADLDPSTATQLSRELADFKTRHTGRKSEIVEAKKLIGKIDASNRGEFGRIVQQVERRMSEAIAQVEAKLNEYIANAQTERERVDVTLPG